MPGPLRPAPSLTCHCKLGVTGTQNTNPEPASCLSHICSLTFSETQFPDLQFQICDRGVVLTAVLLPCQCGIRIKMGLCSVGGGGLVMGIWSVLLGEVVWGCVHCQRESMREVWAHLIARFSVGLSAAPTPAPPPLHLPCGIQRRGAVLRMQHIQDTGFCPLSWKDAVHSDAQCPREPGH